MRIESRILDISREARKSAEPGNAGGRRLTSTSEQAVRFEFGDSTTPSKAAASKPVDVREAVEKLNEFVHSQQKHVNFSIDEATHSTIIKVIRTETGELIKQFPPEEILAMAARIRQNIGWMFDSTM
jgi:flagellar protein FlaG